MTQKLTVLFDLDGTLIDTAPDLMNAHNYVMKKFGYETRSTDEIRNLVGKGAASMIGMNEGADLGGDLAESFSDACVEDIE